MQLWLTIWVYEIANRSPKSIDQVSPSRAPVMQCELLSPFFGPIFLSPVVQRFVIVPHLIAVPTAWLGWLLYRDFVGSSEALPSKLYQDSKNLGHPIAIVCSFPGGEGRGTGHAGHSLHGYRC